MIWSKYVRESAGAEDTSPLSDLEPVGSGAIPASGGLAGGNLAEVDSGGTQVVD